MTPLVCCICPSHIPGYLERAKACFDNQTYQNKIWLPWDTSDRHMTVGALRNAMLRTLISTQPLSCEFHSVAFHERPAPDLIAHFDHDDWSAPTRLAEQVAFMEASGAQVVGYHDMPFYDVERDTVLFYESHNPHYAVGTSLLYRRETWERVPFPDQTPEDTTWQNLVGWDNIASMSSLKPYEPPINKIEDIPSVWEYGRPRMVQTIHKANASPKVGARFQPASAELERAVRNILATQFAFVAQ